MYKVRINSRAKHVSLRLSVSDGLVVTIPRGFDPRNIPPIIDRKRNWLRKVEQKLEAQKAYLREAAKLPETISLPAIGEVWAIDYVSAESKHIVYRELSGNRLQIAGDIQNERFVRKALETWLSEKARAVLTDWLARVAQQCGFQFKNIVIRHQRTRWGSCSSKGTISLNLRLLFVEPQVARYVLVHELAHTKQMNHSRKFWNLVAAHEPDFRRCNSDLRNAWRTIPAWLDYRGAP